MNKWKIQDIQRGVGGFRVIEENPVDISNASKQRESVFISQETKFLSERSLSVGKVMKRLRAIAENFVDKHNYSIDDERERLISTVTGKIRTKKGPFTLIIDKKLFPFKIQKFTERLTGTGEPDVFAFDFTTDTGIEATLVLRNIDEHEIDILVE